MRVNMTSYRIPCCLYRHQGPTHPPGLEPLEDQGQGVIAMQEEMEHTLIRAIALQIWLPLATTYLGARDSSVSSRRDEARLD